MRKSINKISSSVLAGALTCSVLFPAAEKVNISSAALLNMMAGVTKTAAGAAVNAIKFTIKDVVVPLVAAVLSALISSLAKILAVPILYFVIGYIPYYNFCVLHNQNDLGIFTKILVFGARKIIGFLDNNASGRLVSCEELKSCLEYVERSIKAGKFNFDEIKNKLKDLECRLKKVQGKDSEYGAWQRCLKYNLAVLFFPETKLNYDDCETKLKELSNLLNEKKMASDFLSGSDNLIKACLGKEGSVEDLKNSLKNSGVETLANITKRKSDIERLIKTGEKIKKGEDDVDKKVERNLIVLKDLLDILKASEKVSDINNTVTEMYKKAEKVINSCKDFSLYVEKMKKYYFECESELKNKLTKLEGEKRKLSYSESMEKDCLKSKIGEIDSNRKNLDQLMRKFELWKDTLKSTVEKYSDFRPDIDLRKTFDHISRSDYLFTDIKNEKVKSLLSKEVETCKNKLFGEFAKKFKEWQGAIECSKSEAEKTVDFFGQYQTLDELANCFSQNQNSISQQYNDALKRMLGNMCQIRKLTEELKQQREWKLKRRGAFVLENVSMVFSFKKDILSLFKIIKVPAFEKVFNELIKTFEETCKSISFSKEMLEYLLDCKEENFKVYTEILKCFSNYDSENILGFGVSINGLRNIVYAGNNFSLRGNALKKLLTENLPSKDLKNFILNSLKSQQEGIKQENCDINKYSEEIRNVLSLQKDLLSGREKDDAEKCFIDYEFQCIKGFIEKVNKKDEVVDILDYILSSLDKTKEFAKSQSHKIISTKTFMSELVSLLCKVLDKYGDGLSLKKINDIANKFSNLDLNNKIAGVQEAGSLIKSLISSKKKAEGKKGGNSLSNYGNGFTGFFKTLGISWS